MKHICICVLTLLLLMSFIPVCESRTEIIDKGTNDVWAVWVGVEGFYKSIKSAVHKDGEWVETGQVNTDDYLDVSAPCLALDKKGSPRAVWSAKRGDDWGIYYSEYSHKKWSAPVMVSDADVYEDRTPWIAVDSKGKAWVVWAGVDGQDYEI